MLASRIAGERSGYMSQKNGAVIHVERGYQIVEVVDIDDKQRSRFIGYRLLGPGAEECPVYISEGEARFELIQLIRRYGRREST